MWAQPPYAHLLSAFGVTNSGVAAITLFLMEGEVTEAGLNGFTKECSVEWVGVPAVLPQALLYFTLHVGLSNLCGN